MFYYTEYRTIWGDVFGPLTLISEEDNLVGVFTSGQKPKLETDEYRIIRQDKHPVLLQTITWLNAYFSDKDIMPISSLPLAPKGNEFRRIVWDELCKIPYGQTTTYGEIARSVAARMGRKTMSAQAVGGAIGHNPIGIIIPCHRVIGKNGKMVGYAGGLFRKIMLLKHEGAIKNESLFD